MPFIPSEKNIRNAINGHLSQGEMLAMLFGAGRRVFALTSQRFVCTNFPFFAKAKILAQAQTAAIGQVDLSGSSDEQAHQVRDAIRLIFPEAVTLVSEARQGLR